MTQIKAWVDVLGLWLINIWAGLTTKMTLQNAVLWTTLIYTVLRIFFETHAWWKKQRQRRLDDGN